MIQIELSERTEKKMRQVMALHSDTDIFFDKVIDFQVDELKVGLRNMQKELALFEKKYGIESSVFYAKFEQGEFGDEQDFMLWAGVYEIFLRDSVKLELLK